MRVLAQRDEDGRYAAFEGEAPSAAELAKSASGVNLEAIARRLPDRRVELVIRGRAVAIHECAAFALHRALGRALGLDDRKEP
jgi:hypothetical protein